MIQSNNNPQTRTFQASLKSSPFMLRFVFLAVIITKIVDIVTGGWAQSHLVMDRNKVIQQFQIWRPLTSWLYQPNFFALIMMLVSFWPILYKFQKRNSSAVLLNDLLINLYFFAVIFYGIQIALWFFVNPQLPQYTFSIVCIWMNFLYKYSYYNSSVQITLFCSLVKVKIIVYSFLLYSFVCLSELNVRYDGLLGLLLAMIQCRFFNGGMILFPLDTYQDKEKYMQYLGFNKFQCWNQLDEKKIQINHRCTVSSSQFYLNLAYYEPSIQVMQEETLQNSSIVPQYPGSPTRIGQPQSIIQSNQSTTA